MNRAHLWLGIVLGALGVGCAGATPRVSSELAWLPADGTSIGELDEIAVSPGDIVRLGADRPLRIVEVQGTPEGRAEIAQRVTPENGALVVRASLGAIALRVPHGTVTHLGTVKDPEIGWFDLERETLAWARSPLGTPFPALAGAPRIDARDLTDLDTVLREAGDAADQEATRAIRTVVALRAIRALEGVRPYPYARNEALPFDGSARTLDIADRTFSEITEAKAGMVTVEGPCALSVSLRAQRAALDVPTEVRVVEHNTQVRGFSRANVGRLETSTMLPPRPILPGKEPLDPSLALLRNVFVHVPPGKHTYRVEVTGAATWAAAMRTSAFERLEDALAGTKSESARLTQARHACSKTGLESVCALALVLAGDDDGARYASALGKASPLANRLAARFAAGAPRDRAASLEAEAGGGDDAAVKELARGADTSIDPSVRDAWWRATSRTTSWQTFDETAEKTWFTFLPRGTAACANAPSTQTAPELELGDKEVSVFATPWRRTKAIRLVATAPCDPHAAPIELEVDGQRLAVQPSGPRALWRVAVLGDTARVRRLDHGSGHVYALTDGACSDHGILVRPGVSLAEKRSFGFPAGASAPGLEVWLEGNKTTGTMSIASANGKELLEVTARVGGGLSAIDEKGERWQRAAVVALPAWAQGGIVARGDAHVAVRAVARGVASEPEESAVVHAAPPNVELLVAASRELLAARTPESRGAAALKRALLLASQGAERAALEDAELAKSTGFRAPGGEDPVAFVRRSVLPPAPAPLERTVVAYGIEPDFDPRASRCAIDKDGPRAKLDAFDAMLRTQSKSAAFDRDVATRAAMLAAASPDDPRSDSLFTMATRSSSWKLVHDVQGQTQRVPRLVEKERDPVLDAEGRLRARIQAGDPFGANFVSIAEEKPARAFLADIGEANASLELVCLARRHANDGEACPVRVIVGQTNPVPVDLRSGGRTKVSLPRGRGRGRGAELEVSLPKTNADFVALMRIVFDRQVKGASITKDVGWVLDTPHLEFRQLLTPGHPVRVKPNTPGLLRIDALPEPGNKAEVVALVSGKQITLPMNGEPRILAVPAGDVLIETRGGNATASIAERIEGESRVPEGDRDAVTAIGVKQLDLGSAKTTFEQGGWHDVATASPRPLSWLEDRLGTLETNAGARVGTLRDGARTDSGLDVYGYSSMNYRRRIESIDLFTLASGLVRVRDIDNPTFGGSVSVYEDLDALRLRVTGTAGLFAQRVGTETAYTLRPRGFVEYSGRVSSDFFVLPRIGYDGYYTTLLNQPSSARYVDDDVYNAFRFRRNTFAYLQGLFWYVPAFNDIFYVRTRGTYDVTNGAFSHASLRPGAFFIFRALELGAYVDAQYFMATEGARTTSSVDTTFGGGMTVHLPITPGSVEVRPNVTGQARVDGSWEMLAGLSLVTSFRRGVRDYSSLELSYPEETSGGIPWRNANKGP